MIFVSKVILLPLKGITLRVTFPKVPRYGIMAIFPCYFETLVKLFLPSLLVHVLPHSSRDVSMPPSMSWSWVVRYSRRSILLEFSLSSCCLVGWNSQSKTSRQSWWSNQCSYEVHLDREDCVSFVSPLFSYLTSWISGRDSCLVGVSCHSPSFSFACGLVLVAASCLNFA